MVIATVIIGADLLLVLLARVEYHIWEEGEEDEMEESPCEGEVGPVIAVLHDIEAVAIELCVTVKVYLIECLHWDLVTAAPSLAVFFLLKSYVVLDGAAGKLDFVVDVWRVGRSYGPETNQNGQEEDQNERDGRLEAATEAVSDNGRDAEHQSSEEVAREGLRAGSLGG